jgi:hypothetical protein
MRDNVPLEEQGLAPDATEQSSHWGLDNGAFLPVKAIIDVANEFPSAEPAADLQVRDE